MHVFEGTGSLRKEKIKITRRRKQVGRKSSRSQAKEPRVWKVGGASREPLMCRAVLGCKQARMQMQTCRARESARMASLLFVFYLFLDFFFLSNFPACCEVECVCVCAHRGPRGGCCRRPESAGDGTKDTWDKKKGTVELFTSAAEEY